VSAFFGAVDLLAIVFFRHEFCSVDYEVKLLLYNADCRFMFGKKSFFKQILPQIIVL
jgi:hypothetical protein